MSESVFLQRAGAETIDGSAITLFTKPADCFYPGHYRITLIAGKDGAHKKYVIYDVIDSTLPHEKEGAPRENGTNESWCDTGRMGPVFPEG